jgi:hypothetical protein
MIIDNMHLCGVPLMTIRCGGALILAQTRARKVTKEVSLRVLLQLKATQPK